MVTKSELNYKNTAGTTTSKMKKTAAPIDEGPDFVKLVGLFMSKHFSTKQPFK